jgi:hypothetical protein
MNFTGRCGQAGACAFDKDADPAKTIVAASAALYSVLIVIPPSLYSVSALAACRRNSS